MDTGKLLYPRKYTPTCINITSFYNIPFGEYKSWTLAGHHSWLARMSSSVVFVPLLLALFAFSAGQFQGT